MTNPFSNHEARAGPSAATPQPKQHSLVHHRGPGREKKFKNHQNYKIYLNEIKYLQLLIFAKRDFFSLPQSTQSSEYSLIKSSLLRALRCVTFRNFVHPIDCRVLPYSLFTGLGANLKKFKEKPDEVQQEFRNKASIGIGEVEGWAILML